MYYNDKKERQLMVMTMNLKLASPLQRDSIVDGIGLRAVVWVQGCSWNCIDCHNPDTHDFNGGFDKDVDELIDEILAEDMISGVTLSGGDPFFQIESCIYLAKKLKDNGINIWCYTGFLYENLVVDEIRCELLKYIDVLVDGVFINELRTLNLPFRGSSNQRLIDVQESLKANKTIRLNI